VDWRDARPKEPNKLRPAVVVEDQTLFDPAYPNVILVPLTEDRRLAIPDLSVAIDPTPQNGCTKQCYALSHCVSTTSAARVRRTSSRLAADCQCDPQADRTGNRPRIGLDAVLSS